MLEEDWAYASDSIGIEFSENAITDDLKPGGQVMRKGVRLYLGLDRPQAFLPIAEPRSDFVAEVPGRDTE